MAKATAPRWPMPAQARLCSVSSASTPCGSTGTTWLVGPATAGDVRKLARARPAKR
ncbi:hypothetical protein D3C72_2131660 [compost metagenome]